MQTCLWWMQKGVFQSCYSIRILFSSPWKVFSGCIGSYGQKELEKIRFITVQRVCCCMLLDNNLIVGVFKKFVGISSHSFCISLCFHRYEIQFKRVLQKAQDPEFNHQYLMYRSIVLMDWMDSADADALTDMMASEGKHSFCTYYCYWCNHYL